MEKKETINFMQRIKSHYQEFVIDDFRIDEWHKELKKFDAEDVNAKFDEHLRNEFYGEQIPKLHFLTKKLIPSADKGKIKHYTIYCSKCEYEIPDTEFENHNKRCIEASTIVRDMKKHFNQNLQKKKLMELSDEKFNEIYDVYVDKMLESSTVTGIQKKILMHIKYPEYTSDDIDKVIKSMVAK